MLTFKHSVWFKNLWFLEPKIYMSEKFLNYISFGEIKNLEAIPKETLKIGDSIYSVLSNEFADRADKYFIESDWLHHRSEILEEEYFYSIAINGIKNRELICLLL